MHDIEVIPFLGLAEPFSCLSHLIGAFVFAALTPVLLRQGQGDRSRVVSLAIMAAASVQLLLLSSLYHMFAPGPLRDFMLRADVAGIFLLIAGSLTPVHAILFRGFLRWGPLLLAWAVAIVGSLWRTAFAQNTPGADCAILLLLFGWGGAASAVVLWWRFGWAFIQPAILAGMAYTLGAIGLMLHQPVLLAGIIGPHEIWHIAVLTGLGLHWRFVFQFASASNARVITDCPRTEAPLIVNSGPDAIVGAVMRKQVLRSNTVLWCRESE
jgi:channel protein (hemolysin III family)